MTIEEEQSHMTHYNYRMYQVDNVFDEQEMRKALIQSKRRSRPIQLPNIAEQLDAAVSQVKVWLSGTPKPSQQCC
jgi:hypothetical protein